MALDLTPMNGICPKCNAPVTELAIVTLPAKSGKRQWTGVTFNCPLCNTILGAGIDPVLLADQIRTDIQSLRR